jgi:hypothetical protein
MIFGKQLKGVAREVQLWWSDDIGKAVGEATRTHESFHARIYVKKNE